ncbi:MAG: hypothetical protein SGJ19_22730 [Planctomycetia bacterium]|nr:hypothetical protein [Planctomycetia bacterium]
MDSNPLKRPIRFTLRTLLGVVAVMVCLGVLARPTDPTRVENEMSELEVWWRCGWPRDTDQDGAEKTAWWYATGSRETGWWYDNGNREREISSVYVVFVKGRVKLTYLNQ